MEPESKQPAEEEAGLDVDLGKVFDEVNKEEPEAKPTDTPKEEPKPEETQAEEEPAPEEPKVEEPPVTEEPPAEPVEEEVVPPATWTADAKEKFGDLDPVLQQEVLKREKDFAQGVQKFADAAKEAEAYEAVVSPYKAMIQMTGASPQQAFANFLNIEYQLRSATPQQRGQMILEIANKYDADLSQLSPSEETDEYVDPELKKINDKIDSLENKTQSQIQQAQNQQLQTLQQQIEAFKADPENKYFEQVRSTMSALMTNGAAGSLKEAYDQSLRLVPEVFDEIVSNKVKEVETARIKKETDAAEKARKAAGVQLKNEEAGVVPASEGTMQDDLGAAFDKAQAS